jgi:formiminoglutamase
VSKFSPTPASLFFSKNDPQDPRLGDIFKATTVEQLSVENAFTILGYPDDEGIQLNGGRTGAAEAPAKIRTILYKMTPPGYEAPYSFSDIGDLSTQEPLADRHQTAVNTAIELYDRHQRVISLGGGHDYGYADGAAFIRHFRKQGLKPVILNFDAHLDVRPSNKNLNSGTPFYRLLNEFPGEFTFAEIGIQPHCNSPFHRKWAVEKGAVIFDLESLEKNDGLESLWNHNLFKSLNVKTPVFISFDIDGLSSSEAGGCSQSWATGLKIQDYLNFFHRLKQAASVRGLGVYEVSPPLDTDLRTAKVAAQIVYHFLFQDEL